MTSPVVVSHAHAKLNELLIFLNKKSHLLWSERRTTLRQFLFWPKCHFEVASDNWWTVSMTWKRSWMRNATSKVKPGHCWWFSCVLEMEVKAHHYILLLQREEAPSKVKGLVTFHGELNSKVLLHHLCLWKQLEYLEYLLFNLLSWRKHMPGWWNCWTLHCHGSTAP